MFNNDGHRIITGDETYLLLMKNYMISTMAKKPRLMKKIIYAVFFPSTEIVKQSSLNNDALLLQIGGVMLHRNNPSSNTAQQTVAFLRQKLYEGYDRSASFSLNHHINHYLYSKTPK